MTILVRTQLSGYLAAVDIEKITHYKEGKTSNGQVYTAVYINSDNPHDSEVTFACDLKTLLETIKEVVKHEAKLKPNTPFCYHVYACE